MYYTGYLLQVDGSIRSYCDKSTVEDAIQTNYSESIGKQTGQEVGFPFWARARIRPEAL